MNDMNAFIKEKCVHLCPLECQTVEYKYTLSFIQVTGQGFFKGYAKTIANNANLADDFVTSPINGETVGKSLVVLNIYYDSLTYTEITDTENMSYALLLANVASTLGLFLGINVLSLFELIDVLIEIYFILREK